MPLMIGFNRRFDPNFAALQKRLRRRRHRRRRDRHHHLPRSRRRRRSPTSSARAASIRDMMIHDFDMARFLLGEEPSMVHALGSSLVDPAIGKAGDVDTAAVHMQTAAGKICRDLQFAPRHLWLRPAHRGAWLEGPAAAGNVHVTTVELRRRARLHRRPVQNFFLERYAAAYRQRGRRLHRRH